MTTILRIQGTSTGPQAPAGNTVAHVGVASGGAPGTVYQFTGNVDPTATIGYGKLSEFVAQQLRCSRPASGILATLCANQIAGSIGTVTQAPSGGPLPTVTGTPYDHVDLRVQVTTAGAVGVGRVGISLDGATYPYSYDIPDESPGVSIGTVDLTAAGAVAAIGTQTGKWTADTGSLVTVTFASPATIDAVLSQANAAFVSAGSHMVASLSQGKYLKISSVVKGTSSTVTDGPGTANTALGFVDGTVHTGAASTIALVGTGLTLTFPSGSAYVAGVVYSCTVKGPKAALADVLTACQILKDNYDAAPFGDVQIDIEPEDGTDLRAWCAALDALFLGWQSASRKTFPVYIIGSPLGLTGPSGIAANDIDVRNAMVGHTSLLSAGVAHGDCYMTGTTLLGSHRRSAVQPLGIRIAGQSLSEDPGNAKFKDPSTGNGSLPECSLSNGDKTLLARDENTATTKLGGSEGPGFCVLKTKPEGVFFVAGVTRAGPTSVFRDTGVLRMTYYAAGIVQQLLEGEENATEQLAPDGTLDPSVVSSIGRAWTRTLQGFIVTSNPPHASAASVTVDGSEVVADTRNLTATFAVQTRGQIKTVTGILSVSGLQLQAAA